MVNQVQVQLVPHIKLPHTRRDTKWKSRSPSCQTTCPDVLETPKARRPETIVACLCRVAFPLPIHNSVPDPIYTAPSLWEFDEPNASGSTNKSAGAGVMSTAQHTHTFRNAHYVHCYTLHISWHCSTSSYFIRNILYRQPKNSDSFLLWLTQRVSDGLENSRWTSCLYVAHKDFQFSISFVWFEKGINITPPYKHLLVYSANTVCRDCSIDMQSSSLNLGWL